MIAEAYLILIIHGHALWGSPRPHPSQEACEEAGRRWDSGGPPEPGARGHYCLPAPIIGSGYCTRIVVGNFVETYPCTVPTTGSVK